MDAHEVAKLPLGLYRIYYKSSGTSLAAVGNNSAGLRWLAAVNWVSREKNNQRHWDEVDRVEAIEPDALESDAGELSADAVPDISDRVAKLEGEFSAILDAAQESIRINTSLRNEVIGLRKRTDDLLKLHEKSADTCPSVSVGAPPDLEDVITITGLRITGSIVPPGPHRFRMEPSSPLDKEEEDQHLHRTIEYLGTQVAAMIAGATIHGHQSPKMMWCPEHKHWIWGGPDNLQALHMGRARQSSSTACGGSMTRGIRSLATAAIVLAFFTLGSTAVAQVNTEALRREGRSSGWHTGLAADLGILAGNSALVRLRSNLRFDYLTERGHTFFVAQYQRGVQGRSLFLNKGFAHLRRVRTLNPRYQVEAFLQREFNDFINLDDRQLVGGGLRIRWRQSPDSLGNLQSVHLNIGFGAMWERERIDTTGQAMGNPGHGPVTSLIRSTNYLVFQLQLDDRLILSSTTYYQVNLSRFADYRILWEGALNITLTRRLSLRLNLNLRYDSEPPTGVKPLDLEITNGLSYSL